MCLTQKKQADFHVSLDYFADVINAFESIVLH